jgi:hypothetical protein
MSDRAAARMAILFHCVVGPFVIASLVDAARNARKWEKSRRAVAYDAAHAALAAAARP